MEGKKKFSSLNNQKTKEIKCEQLKLRNAKLLEVKDKCDLKKKSSSLS